MPKIVDHDEYRRELMQRAVGSFAREGFASLSMKDLAGSLDVSPASFYHYFKNKEDLFFQMTAQLASDLVSNLTSDMAPTLSRDERVAEMLDRLESREEDFRHLYLIIQDFMRVIGVRKFRQSDRFGSLFVQTHLALREALGLSEREMDFIFTYVSGIIHNRTLYPGAASVKSHKAMLLSILKSDEFQGLDLLFEETPPK